MRPVGALVVAQLVLLSALAGRAASANHVHPLLGGLTEQDVNNPVYRDLATESLELYMKRNGLIAPHGVLQITEVTTQVVAGLITRIDFIAILGYSTTTCHSEILEKPWLSHKKIDKHIDVTCEGNDRTGASAPSSAIERDVNDPKYWDLAQVSLAKHEQEHGCIKCHRVSRILRVTEQTSSTASGFITRIKFIARLKTDIATLNLLCHSDIWEQPWYGPKNIKVRCNYIVS